MLSNIIKKYILKYKLILLLCTILSLFLKIILILFIPLIMKNIINNINILNYNIYVYLKLLLLLILCYIVKIIINNITEYIGIHICGKIGSIDSIIDTLNIVLEHSITFFINNSSGEIKTDIEELSRNIEFIIKPIFFNFLPYIMVLIFYSLYLSKYNTHLAIFIFLWSIIFSLISCYFSKKVMDEFTNANKEKTILGGRIEDIIVNIVNIKIFTNKQYEIEHLKTYTNNLFLKRKSSNISFMKEDIYLSLIDLSFNIILLLLLIICFIKQTIDISTFFFIFYSTQFILNENINFVRWIGITISRIGEAKNNIKVLIDKNKINDNNY